MRARPAASVPAGLVLLLAVSFALAPARAAPAPSAGHYVPKAGDSLKFEETIAVGGGYGNYSGYTETDAIVGTLDVTAVLPNGTETATYAYGEHYSNSTGANYHWWSNGTFTFSANTFDYVQGTDNQSGYNGSGEWFYMNDSLGPGSTIVPLDTVLTVGSNSTSYPLDTAAGTNVRSIYTDGVGNYTRDDSYGVFSATYDWRSYFDPGTGYIVGYNYTELDSNSAGDGFVYTDDLKVTATSYALTAGGAPAGYDVKFTETGLPSGTPWTLTFDGTPYVAGGTSVTVPGVENGTYLYGVRAPGYTVTPDLGFVTERAGASSTPLLTFASASSSPAGGMLLFVEVGLAVLVLIVILVVVVYALARRSRRPPPLPQHSAGGRPQYAPIPSGPAPPPISLGPRDQPQIQQVVVKEVVKVNCRYCGSLIDSTAEKCPFCGATRT